jgi:prephenate dehydratase
MDVGRRPCKQNKDKDRKLATWNVRSLNRPGALAKLKDELNKYGIAITAVQEIR